ncbi:MAG: transcription-repair coupling factor [Lutispora sp.]|nr:transcription-repair coupling factor [Lutispora sp.]MDD4833468.1 transcription-repair coupling factor [Lutispora sp.]
MDNILMPLESLEEYKYLIKSLRENTKTVEIHGISDAQKSMVIAGVSGNCGKSILIITHNDILARKIYEDISFFDPDAAVLLPTAEMIFHKIDARSNEIEVNRLKALHRLGRGDRVILCASVEALLSKMPKPDYFYSKLIDINIGDQMPVEDFTAYFATSGYERVDMIEGRGQFSIRGGIIDFYGPTEDYPVRIELFDDEVDSIRHFDPGTQRSLKKLKTLSLFPMKEMILEAEDFVRASITLEKELNKRLKLYEASGKKKGIGEKLREKIAEDLEKIKSNMYFQGIDRYLAFFYEESHCIIDYLRDFMVVVDEPNRVRQRFDNVRLEYEEHFKSLLEEGELLPEQLNAVFTYDDILLKIKDNQIICFNALLKSTADFKPQKTISFLSRSMQPFHGKINLLIDEIKLLRSRRYKILILAGSKDRGERLAEGLKDDGIEALYQDKLGFELKEGHIIILPGNLSGGFEFPSIKYAIITDMEVFGGGKRKTAKKKAGSLKFFSDLKAGDYVVHENHGIGQYMGIERLKVNNVIRDYLHIRYFGNDKLYIPTDQFDLIQKYIAGDRAPKINRLSGVEWVKTKARAKKAIEGMADELLKLYAERQQMKGFSFSKDGRWQKDFEDMFPFQETPDQLNCIEEIKKDMETDKAMDRLLCGDVGYGKTEVALRAAFKCIMDGKQVAILVPTTILAQQHFNTCNQRFGNFPMHIDMLSRFRSAQEQKKTLEALRIGAVDLVIGTHRLLQNDITFKDLGLLIVDEEQRFGVVHKEKIKQMRQNVDVLTLTATPIPRTLHMSLIGIRDISVIEEPPEERYPVQTYVMEYNDEIVRDAILREINRGGQIYFLYNRVRTIGKMAERLKVLVPEAKIAVAHGQMDERLLENTMLDFYNGEYDLLLCTTIIETGLDIPNVNTIIVHDADKMGLSQLYQLRGRVGRSNRLAYAYLTYQRDKVLTEVAEKRLQAIKEFTEFGSGFKIAMRDLEIRGAGNLLGREQHGHMESIGYDLYTKLLEDTVRELTGRPLREKIDTTIEFDIEAYIPLTYIEDENQKIEVYQKIASIDGVSSLYDIEEEIEDRFGDIPDSVSNLMMISYIKYMASKLGMILAAQKPEGALFKFKNDKYIKAEAAIKLMDEYGHRVSFMASEQPYFIYKLERGKDDKYLKSISDFLEKLAIYNEENTDAKRGVN